MATIVVDPTGITLGNCMILMSKFCRRSIRRVSLKNSRILRISYCVCAVFVLGGVKLFAQQSPLDDTAAFIHLAPNPVNGFACDEFVVNVQITATNARVFDLRFIYDSDNFTLTSVTEGSHAALNLMPHMVDSDTLYLDGFFHPNFTGTTVLASLHFMANNLVGDQLTMVGFIDGQGFSGTGEAPDPMIIIGDSTTVNLEGTLPLPPDLLVIVPILADSVCLHWHAVHYDTDGDTVINPQYLVEFEDVLNNQGIYNSIGTTFDTFFYHDFIIYEFDPGDTGTVNVGTYRIRATKCPE